MRTEIFCIETPGQFATAVARAADLLAQGEVVALPTETVYGLAASAINESAVKRIYAVKGRPSLNPIIVHVDSIAMARLCTTHWPKSAHTLAAAFWPGPLTLVLPKSGFIPPIVTAGGDTVAIRWAAHPFIRAVIKRCHLPLAAPSANLSNQLSPTTGHHVLRMLDGQIPLIVDAGPSSVGIESTVLDLTTSPPRILRAGMISSDQIAQALGTPLASGPAPAGTDASSPLKSPGQLSRHYSPRARLVIAQWQNGAELDALIQRLGSTPAQTSILAHDRIPETHSYARVAVIPHDPEAYARALYAELHLCDQLGSALILVEALPSTSPWQAIRDRLTRASTPLS